MRQKQSENICNLCLFCKIPVNTLLNSAFIVITCSISYPISQIYIEFCILFTLPLINFEDIILHYFNYKKKCTTLS